MEYWFNRLPLVFHLLQGKSRLYLRSACPCLSFFRLPSTANLRLWSSFFAIVLVADHPRAFVGKGLGRFGLAVVHFGAGLRQCAVLFARAASAAARMAKARGVLRLVPRALVGRFCYPREGVHVRQPRCADQDAVSVLGAGGAGGGLFAPGNAAYGLERAAGQAFVVVQRHRVGLSFT